MASRDEFHALMSRPMPDAQRIIELARFVERLPDRKTNPSLLAACATIGRHHARADRPALAAAWFERAVAEAPDEPSLLNLLGYHYAEHELSLHRAIEMLSRAVRLALDRNYPPRQIAYFKDSLGWAFRGNGNWQKAITLLREARDLAPEVAIIEKHLAQVYRDLETRGRIGSSVLSGGERSASSERGEVDIGGDLQTLVEDRDAADMETGSKRTGVDFP
jgi:tetratricopeptide (TPR) repeat protein